MNIEVNIVNMFSVNIEEVFLPFISGFFFFLPASRRPLNLQGLTSVSFFHGFQLSLPLLAGA